MPCVFCPSALAVDAVPLPLPPRPPLQSVLVNVFYSKPKRLDVYVDNQLIAPTNAEWNAENTDYTTMEPLYPGTSHTHTRTHKHTHHAEASGFHPSCPHRSHREHLSRQERPGQHSSTTINRQTDQFTLLTLSRSLLSSLLSPLLSSPLSSGHYVPALDSSLGTNFFDRDTKMLRLLVRGSEPVEVRTSPLLVIAFNLPAMTEDEFFGDSLVQNLALFLKVPSSMIRITKVVREDGGARRRKRAAAGLTVEVEIQKPPVQQTSNSTDGEQEEEEGGVWVKCRSVLSPT